MSDLDFSTDESKASYGVGLQMGQQLHLGKISIALEKSKAERDLWNFAGN